MQGHTKKPHTDAVSVTFTGPIAMMEQAQEAMRALGFEIDQLPSKQSAPVPQNQEVGGSNPWRESSYFKEMPFPGAYISGARYRESMTQMQLAERTGIPRRHISEMENGKRPIGKSNARKLAEVLNIDPRVLLSV